MSKVIEINNLIKYYGDTLAVDNISFSVNEGEIFGFIGQNGAGKSTTIRILLNMIFQSEGEAKIFNKDCIKESKEIKKDIGYVPSEVEYYRGMRAIDIFKYTLKFDGDESLDRVYELCEYLELDYNKKIEELSLGNKKKVSLIQALIRDPKLIILDEPTSGLDPLIQEKLFTLLMREKDKGMSVFLSSHNLDEVEKYCDRVAIIKKGKIMDIKNVKDMNSNRKLKVSYFVDGKEEKYEYEGDINVLIKKLAKLKIENLEIKKLSLQEQFIKYYGGEENE